VYERCANYQKEATDMFDDIKELIDQAAPQPNQSHRDELWQQFQQEAQPTTVTASRPTTVLRPPAPKPAPSDTIILETIEPADELAKRRNHRRIYGALAVAAAVVTIAGIAAVSRNGKTVQVAPAAEPTTTIANGDATSSAPTVPQPTAVPTTGATVATTTATTTASTAPPKTAPATTVAPATTLPATTVPKTVTTVGTPGTKLVTVLAPDYAETMTAIGGWDGKNFVKLPTKVAPGPYQTLNGERFDVEFAKPDAEGHVHAGSNNYPKNGTGISFSATSWPLQPRAARSQGDPEALKDPRFNIYREEASRLAKELGGANVMPVLSSVVRADLDGDGTDEVLVAASYIDYVKPPQGPEPATVGSFSIAYVRHVVGNAAPSKVLSAVVVKDTPSIVPTLVIDGAADINGDGVMEVFGSGYLYEAANFYCWDAGSVDSAPKVLFSVFANQ
jgi:hypothetical protein